MVAFLFCTLLLVYMFTAYGINEATYSNSDFLVLIGAFVQLLLCVGIASFLPLSWAAIIIPPLVFIGIYPMLNAMKVNRILPVDLGIKLRSSLDDEL
jgi:hypothetical protein